MDSICNDIGLKLRSNKQFHKRVVQFREVIGLESDLLPDTKKYVPRKVSTVVLGVTMLKMFVEPCYQSAKYRNLRQASRPTGATDDPCR